mmetsp:Transcript_33230/g.94942  ORF Transcript_33230/g.94942 Transcript_33230/m.94942 type:complete len:229 (+) Transcript_33230:6700-7386(+)
MTPRNSIITVAITMHAKPAISAGSPNWRVQMMTPSRRHCEASTSTSPSVNTVRRMVTVSNCSGAPLSCAAFFAELPSPASRSSGSAWPSCSSASRSEPTDLPLRALRELRQLALSSSVRAERLLDAPERVAATSSGAAFGSTRTSVFSREARCWSSSVLSLPCATMEDTRALTNEMNFAKKNTQAARSPWCVSPTASALSTMIARNRQRRSTVKLYCSPLPFSRRSSQ